MANIRFKVIDKTTGKEADTYMIALKEEWAKRLCYCDMEGWFIGEDGYLMLADECSNYAYPPDPNRFEVVFLPEEDTYEPDRQISIDEYLHSLKGEEQ